MVEKLSAEFIEAIHTDESKRLVVENKYDCWETVPINSGYVTLTRGYKGTEDEIKEAVIDLKKDGLVKDIKPTKYWVEVEYDIPLVDIQIPNKFPLGYQVNMDKIIEYAEFYESFKTAPDILEKRVQEFVNKGAATLKLAIEGIKEIDPNAPFPEIVDSCSNIEDLARWETLNLMEAFPEAKTSKPSEIIKYVKTAVDVYLEKQEDPKFNELKTYMKGEIYDGFENDTSLTPCPAIYHDDMTDSRFETSYSGNTLKAEVIMGNIATHQIAGDIDASASFAFYKTLKSRLSKFDSQIGRDEPIYSPPNMENLYIMHIPVITDEINSVEKNLKLAYDISSAVMVLCSDPTRLNPEVIQKTFNDVRGENGWILATIDPDTLELRRVVAKPKEEWKVIPKKPRANIPLSLGENEGI